tara:strand:+ start:37343 stop:37495 length:153 start_codon:yes stop_codon:yes gene_type:complete
MVNMFLLTEKEDYRNRRVYKNIKAGRKLPALKPIKTYEIKLLNLTSKMGI